MSSNMDEIIKLLEKEKVKPTFERLSILQYLEKKHNHPTAAMIYDDLVKRIPTISKTTVYNSLNLFIEKGIVTPLYITGSEVRFDLNTSQHHHFLCEKCGRIYDITIVCPFLSKTEIQGHQIKQKHGYFRGICKHCLEKENNSQ